MALEVPFPSPDVISGWKKSWQLIKGVRAKLKLGFFVFAVLFSLLAFFFGLGLGRHWFFKKDSVAHRVKVTLGVTKCRKLVVFLFLPFFTVLHLLFYDGLKERSVNRVESLQQAKTVA